MNIFERLDEDAAFQAIRKKNHQHTDIFNSRGAEHLVIRNDDPVVNENIFQRKVDSNRENYENTMKRPSSSYNKTNVVFQEGSYAFNQDWSSPNQFSSKTLVNQNANFGQDYHHLRRYQESTSNIFASEGKHTPGTYKKNIVPIPQKTLHPQQSEIHGRKNVLRHETQKTNKDDKKYNHNYSNLFGLGERTEKVQIKEEKSAPAPLIPSGLSWEQCDSGIQTGKKDQVVGEDYHKKRYHEDMKSSLGNHAYQVLQSRRPSAPVDEIIDIVNKYGHLLGKQVSEGNQNNQVMGNRRTVDAQPPKTCVITKKTVQRPNSAVKVGSRPKNDRQVQISVTKGLTSKFNLNSLCQQCRLHSLVLSSYANTVAGEKGTGRGTIKVVPQKKYGLDVLCSWLRSQGLSIVVRSA